MSFGLNRILKNILPKRLFYRGLLIVAVPILILQITISLVFFDSLWIKTNKGLTKALVSEIVTIIDIYDNESQYNKKIDLKKLFIFKDDQRLKINNTEKLILEKMINSPGKIYKRDEIASLIDLNKERSIDVIITRLRKKIEETPKNPKYLQTIRGEGYVLWIE